MKKECKPNRFLTAKQVAEEFFGGRYHYQRILKFAREGKLPALKAGRCYLFLESELEKWTEKNFSTPAWNTIKL